MKDSEQRQEIPVQVTNFTSPTGIDLQVQTMDREQSEIFILATLADQQSQNLVEGMELPFLSEVVKKRIEVYNLPISFTVPALVAINALVELPGQAVTLLIDALNKYESGIIDMEKLAELYPYGFYTKESFMKYVDEYLKPRKVPWAELY